MPKVNPNIPRVKCKGTAKSTGGPCKNNAIPGGTVCNSHGGKAPQVANKAAVRAEVMSWGLDATTVDPGETLLRLVSQSAARATMYAAEIESLVATSPSLKDALVADSWVMDKQGNEYKAGEYIRGLAVLEAQERDRCAGFAAKAVAAGLAERQVRLAERQEDMSVELLRTALRMMGKSDSEAKPILFEALAEVRRNAIETTSKVKKPTKSGS
jgi:hypothetical protein